MDIDCSVATQPLVSAIILNMYLFVKPSTATLDDS